MTEIAYNRENAVNYAKEWALKRNPQYYDYSEIGGNCTNFASQSVFAGCTVMNYNMENGWYYLDANNKSPSWTGVEFFYDFITQNNGVGPYGEVTQLNSLKTGDIIQFADRNGRLYHTVVLTGITRGYRGRNYYVCSNSRDAYQKNLRNYNFYSLKCIHILGARKE